MEKMKERLKELIWKHAFQYSEAPAFKLAHGGVSRFYFNCKKVTLDPEGLYLVGHLVLDRVKDLRVKGIGGLTLGADPIAAATAYTSWAQGCPLQAFVVRKKEKDHGVAALVEGRLEEGDDVVVVDDVVTTGGSTLRAVEACRQAGLRVVKAVVLVDRQEMGGLENIRREVPDVEVLVSRDEIMELHRNMKTVSL